ncbi:MAG: caspase family protein [Treponema sp.]|nr:caspase family protein [Treponema sp.]
MKKLFAIILIFIAMGIFTQRTIHAQQKFALVIGNGNYTGISRLNNPVNDANDMETVLRSLGFTVDKVLNGNLDQMETAVTNLSRRLGASSNSYGFFFYAGHGVQSGGENYLIPVDATSIHTENHLRQRAVSLQTVLDNLNDAGNALNVVVLDACRDNPFGWARSGNRGLSVVGRPPADSIIVYATSAGSVAMDGTGRNGAFTTHLLNNLKTPGLEVQEMFRRTMGDVARASNNQQRPEYRSQFYETAYLGTQPAPAPAPTAQPTPAPTAQPAPAVAVTPAPAATRPLSEVNRTYQIGDTGPAGGIVFYDKGSVSNGWRYLEVAPAETEFSDVQWGAIGVSVGGTRTTVGSGKRNTELLVEYFRRSGASGLAAQLCAGLSFGGYTDWFLPSKGELDLMYKNLREKGWGGFASTWYWSSSESNSGNAWDQRFSGGTQDNRSKTNAYRVRAIRAF